MFSHSRRRVQWVNRHKVRRYERNGSDPNSKGRLVRDRGGIVVGIQIDDFLRLCTTLIGSDDYSRGCANSDYTLNVVEVEIDLHDFVIGRISVTAMNNINDKEWWRAMNEIRCLRDDFSVAEPTIPIRAILNTTQRRK
jgi:hypothetical protein